MKYKNQVCSLKLAKRLRKLGVKQDSLWYWVIYLEKWELDCFTNKEDLADVNDYVSGFTVAELGEMLPQSWLKEIKKGVYVDFESKDIKGWCFGNSKGLYRDFAITEADARAKLLIYCIEEKFIKIKEINGK